MNVEDLIPVGFINGVKLEQLADEFLVPMLVGNLLTTHLTTTHQSLMDMDTHTHSTTQHTKHQQQHKQCR